MNPACPTCSGPQVHPHPAGALVFQHDQQCALLAAEDATQVADAGRATWKHQPFDRPATDAERALLAAVGREVPEVCTTRVQYLTHSVRRRTWPTAPPLATPDTEDAA